MNHKRRSIEIGNSHFDLDRGTSRLRGRSSYGAAKARPAARDPAWRCHRKPADAMGLLEPLRPGTGRGPQNENWRIEIDKASECPLTRPPATLSPSEGERDGVKGTFGSCMRDHSFRRRISRGRRPKSHLVCAWFWLWAILLPLGFSPLAFGQAPPRIPPAYGPYVNLTDRDFADAKTFSNQDRIVGTYYFYWYDVHSKSHVIDGDGTDALTTHPPTLDDFSYTSVAWHKKQLEDMIAAGIDVVLPVFWGAPSEQKAQAGLHWSYAGLPPLVQAREELLRAGKSPPRIGLFYDTSTLRYNGWGQHIDLTTDYGRAWFYATIRDFFSHIPARHWAMINGRPIILLYSAAFAKNHDQSCIDYVKARFPEQFGGRVPWIAREISWHVQADNTVAWGGALGLKNPGVGSLGPGYDHSAVPGRAPLVVDRRNGKFYEENWLKFLRRPSPFVMVETWNEYHEGTDVSESREYGRRYIELTRKYSELFKQGWTPPWPQGSYTGAPSVSITLGQTNLEKGLILVDSEDGHTAPAQAGDRACRRIVPSPGLGRYVYLAVDDSFKGTNLMDCKLEVTFFDAASGTLSVEFDGSDPTAPFAGAYSRSPETETLQGTKQWRQAQFSLPRARFLNAQNRGADLRLVVTAPDFYVDRVVLSRH
jgi:Domain of unknown function (DUF5010)